MGSDQFEAHIGHPSLKFQHMEDQPAFSGWRAGGANKRAVGNSDPTHEEHVNTCLLPKRMKRVN